MADNQGDTDRRRALLVIGAILALLVALHIYRPPTTGLWIATMYNSVHVPVFMLVTLGLVVAFRSATQLRFGRCIVYTSALAVLLAVVSEAAQIMGPRDASVEDLVADWLGTFSMVLLIVAAARSSNLEQSARIIAVVAGCFTALIAIWPLIQVSAAYVERNSKFPVLFAVESRFEHQFLRVQNSTIGHRDQESVAVTFGDGPWPGLVFHDLWPDWSNYAYLQFSVELESAEPLDINIRVHDKLHSVGDQAYNDRFNMNFKLQLGRQTIKIPLHQIKRAPRSREMNISSIDGMAIFATRAESGRSFVLYEIRLIP